MNRKQRRAERKQGKPVASAGIANMFADAVRNHQTGHFAEAEWLYRQILSFDPRHSDSLHLLGVIAHQQGHDDVAVDLIGQAITLNAKVASYHSNLGIVLQELGRLDDALACWRKAVALEPGYQEAHYNLGTGLWYRGRFEEAFAVHQIAARLGTDPCAAYYGMSICRKFTEAERSLVGDIKRALQERPLPSRSQALLHFALGKVFDDLTECETAIGHFDEANRLERERGRFDRVDFAAVVDWLIGAFSKNSPKAAAASQTELPIFVVGMPRSGTTLVEQILTSHPEIASVGELRFWQQRADIILKRQVGQLDPTAEQEAVRDYVDRLAGASAGAARVIDKNPYNFLLLGLLHKLLPQARIIHCRRHPVDMALSLYFTRFARSNDFAYDRGDIVLYYREYRRLMEHWRTVLPPDRIIDIDYERLVADPEPASRQLVAFCGLKWDDACIGFHKTDRAIRTASAWQARQPIYRSSVDRWRRYEPWLGEFRSLLEIA